ncbi:SdpI family protein [Corynebacterium choanae]|uniref:SdpI/YhfL protein family protein n=1 Tax=Corynebacterium choanae TaxID=1862358 RepID=A0A3G6J9F4_9CORY|nr:SdpI family protein [Corynebacterium choanae]AZA14697.1 hypothetical protein CCHOA_11630 [Corynebacterium choanae]
MVVIASILLLLAVGLIVLGALAWAGKLPGNGIVGIRVPASRKRQFLWDVAHKVAGPIWVVGGVAWLLGGLVALRAEGWLWIIPALAAIAGFILFGTGSAMGANAATTVAKNTPEPAPSGCCSAGDTTAGDNAGVSGTSPEGSCGGDCSGGGCGSTAAPNIDLAAARKAAAQRDNAEG